MKNAVITGANRGLGFHTAKALAEKGYHVVITARSQAKADAAANELSTFGSVEGREMDVSGDQSVNAFFDWYFDTHGSLDVLVNNAGAIFERNGDGYLDPNKIPADVIAQAFNTNTLSVHRTIQRAMPVMNENGYGRIVNVSSGMGQLSDMGGGHTAYRLSKVAMNALTKIWQVEARGDVKVNSICPGWVKTDMGGENASRDIEEGISGIVWAATLDADGPSGGFFRDGERIDW